MYLMVRMVYRMLMCLWQHSAHIVYTILYTSDEREYFVISLFEHGSSYKKNAMCVRDAHARPGLTETSVKRVAVRVAHYTLSSSP